MKISIKTLKGELFQVEIDETAKVADLKTKIEESREDHGAARQKLIHAGKVLKDEQVISEIGIAEADFIVCMITKEVAKKPVAAPAPAAPVAAPAPAQVAATPAADPRPAAAAPNTPLASSGAQFVTAEGLAALMGMGFPESESRAALSAAMGNPDLAYEFLLTGIPPAAAQRVSASPAAAAPAGAVTIDALRRHPQFNMLKQLVQTNPGALSQVLDLIGQQSPELLAAIHANNDAFIAMMNEPIVDTPPPAPAPVAQAPPGGMGGGNPLSNPAVMMQMLAAMPAAQRAQFAQQLGMDPQQLEGMMQMMAAMPPEQMEAILNQGMGGGHGHSHGADPPGVIRLTEEEMAAVNRLVALGFSQQQAAQAYLACDKNETLAANLLFEGGWGDDEGGMGGFDGGDEDDNMYN